MRLLEVFKDFLKIFIPVEKKKLAINYSAKVKDWSLSKSQLIEKKFILKQINLFKKKRILDYGCNDCSFSNILKKKISYWGVDNNPELLNRKINKYSKKFKFLKTNKIQIYGSLIDGKYVTVNETNEIETLYVEDVFGTKYKISIEAGLTETWKKYVGKNGICFFNFETL